MIRMKNAKQHGLSLVADGRSLVEAGSGDAIAVVIRNLPSRVNPPNTIVDIHSPSGAMLSVGIALPRTDDNPELTVPLAYANYTRPDRMPPYLAVVGDPDLTFQNGGVVVFRYEEGTWTEALRRNCVPLETLYAIVDHFAQHDSLPQWIPWEQI